MHEQFPLSQINNAIFSSNTYFFQISGSDKCFVIDPGLDFENIDKHLSEKGLTPVAVLCTHGHFDHLGSAQLLKNKYGCKIYLHKGDLKTSKAANFLLMVCKIDQRILTPVIDFLFKGEMFIAEIEGVVVKWQHLPGHTPGSCFIMINNLVFTGDTLYKKAVGLSDFPGENKAELIQSIKKIWDVIPDMSVIYPGHGGSDTFGNIKIHNHALRSLLGLSLEVRETICEE